MYIKKFDASLGNILTSETFLENLHASKQRPGENIATLSCRLEPKLVKAKQKSAMIENADQTLRSKFHKGIRHHNDSVISFNYLLQ